MTQLDRLTIMRRFQFLLLGLPLALACRLDAEQRPPGGDVVITGVDVVAMDSEGVASNQTVVIQGEQIVAIGSDLAEPTAATVRIDGRGKYLVPGLADMHIHLPASRQLQIQLLQLHLVNGVTTVLNLDGTTFRADLARQIEDGELTGPRILSSGPTLRGPPQTRTQGREAVQSQVGQGFKILKVYSFLSADAYQGIIEEADRYDLTVTGHAVRAAGGIEAAIANGQHLAHMEELIYGYFRQKVERESFPQDPAGAAQALSALLDESQIDGLAGRLAAAGIFVTPNLTAYYNILRQVRDLKPMLDRPEVRYLPAPIQDSWGPRRNRYTTRPNLDRFEAILATTLPFLQKLTDRFQQAGVKLLMGTDAPVPVVVPGFGAHDELQEMVKAGLTPYEALRTATLVPAEFLSLTDTGTIHEGARADLLLLDANPLEDISNTRRINGVIRAGRWFPRSELDRMLAQLEQDSN